jgi:hypothetical protein
MIRFSDKFYQGTLIYLKTECVSKLTEKNGCEINSIIHTHIYIFKSKTQIRLT